MKNGSGGWEFSLEIAFHSYGPGYNLLSWSNWPKYNYLGFREKNRKTWNNCIWGQDHHNNMNPGPLGMIIMLFPIRIQASLIRKL